MTTTTPAAKHHLLAKLGLAATIATTLLLGLTSHTPAHAATPTTIWTDRASTGGTCSDTQQRSAATPTHPVCTLARASALALPGDTVMVRPATYPETLRPTTNGTTTAPIRYTTSAPGVIINATNRATGILLIGATDLRFSGFTINHATTQAIWATNAARISFDHLTLTHNQVGAQLKTTTDITIQTCTITANTGGGIMELGAVQRGRYLTNTITNNGHDTQPYNGDGIQLRGTNATISGNTISGNGDNLYYEHGIYASTQALGYTIDHNQMATNSATNIKAEGSGIVRDNQLGSARLGVYVDQNTAPGVSLHTNAFSGSFLHAVQSGTGALLQQWNNTINAQPMHR
jgi:hypothetical protein